MRLYKFCKPEHNAIRSHQLLVGSLQYYRSIENEEIADKGEGSYKFNIQFSDQIKIDIEIANLLFDGAIGYGNNHNFRIPGSFSAHVKHLEIGSVSDDFVIINKAEVQIDRVFPNIFIFCMSIQPENSKNPFQGYSDEWSIPIQNANEFARIISMLIQENIRFSDIGHQITENNPISSLNRIQVAWQHKPVIYRDRDIIYNKDNLYNKDSLIETVINIPFVKPKKFSSENEYRFAFQIQDGTHVFPPISERIFLPLNHLNRILG
jgi:hypothetical protein